MEVYYHYTNPDSAIQIIKRGVIHKSSKKSKRRDARYGDGVYLTQMPPTTPKFEIAFNNYDGQNEAALLRMISKGRVNAYIKLRLNPAEVVECEDEVYGRDIYLYPDRDLHIQPYMKPEVGIIE